jgi:hypothetical protein
MALTEWLASGAKALFAHPLLLAHDVLKGHQRRKAPCMVDCCGIGVTKS